MVVKIIPKIKLPLAANSVFDYLVPKEMEPKIMIGQIVEVEFRNLKIEAMVLEIEKLDFRQAQVLPKIKKLRGRTFTLKPIIKILDESPILYEKQIEAMKWISEYYFTPLSNALRMFVPDVPKLKKLRNKEIKKLGDEYRLSVLKSRLPDIKKAIEDIKNSKNDVVFQWNVLQEKILVYIKLIEDCILKNQQILILVPQISDIEFLSGYLQLKFKSKIAVLHGGLGKIETYTNWTRIRKNQAKIILGTRSSILAPMKNPGLIIIDDEESSGHKQYDMNPRYDARRIVKRLGVKVVFASSAPRVETYQKLRNSVASLLEIKKLRDGFILVKLVNQKIRVELVDMANELRRGEYSPISRKMEESMRKSLGSGKKTILFLNRKGTSTMAVCRDCKFLFKCAKCDLPLVYHADAEKLFCHHCGFKCDFPMVCAKCHGSNIKFVGTGTQKIEQEARKLFPYKKIIRIDKDATYYKLDIEKYDIVIGTQLLFKNFKIINKAGFLGIVSLDVLLSKPDFRASEKLYQLMANVLGWARFNKIDNILWQTFSWENELINLAANQNYDKFFEQELQGRKEFNYPPFCKLVKFIYKNTNQKKVKFEAGKLVKNLRGLGLADVIVIGPIEPFVKQVGRNYIEIVVLKIVDLSALRKIPFEILKGWLVDVEPETINC